MVLKTVDKVAIIKNSKILDEYSEKNTRSKEIVKMEMSVQTDADPLEPAYKKIVNEIQMQNSQPVHHRKSRKLEISDTVE